MTHSHQQLAKEVYNRAERFLPHNVRKQVFKTFVKSEWIDEGDAFWYRMDTRDGMEFVLVNPEEGQRRPAFDHQKLASSLSKATGKPYEHGKLPFNSISFTDNSRLEFSVDGQRWQCNLDSYECTQVRTEQKGESVSPDGKWALFLQDHNLWLRCMQTGEEKALTFDGQKHFAYAATPESSTSAITDQLTGKTPEPVAKWSSDSRQILTHQLDERKVREMCLLQSVPSKGGYCAEPHYYRYALPGDEHIAQAHMIIVDLEDHQALRVKAPPLMSAASAPTICGHAGWAEDDQCAYFLRFSRGYSSVSLEAVDPCTGEVKELLHEDSVTNVAPYFSNADEPMVAVLDGGSEVLWFSKSDGWGHLYLYDGDTGELKHQVTSGAWSVRQIVHIDRDGRQVYFLGGGREAGRDPYLRHLYRVGLDGGECELLTPENADHQVCVSPTGRFFVDNYSRADTDPVSVLRCTDGQIRMHLEQGDLENLKQRGWQPPETFCVKARDGITDIYGAIYRPTNFDPDKKYPVIDAIYPGPQVIRAPKFFPRDVRSLRGYFEPQSMAELGFIVITIDGMGTPFRSRALLEVSYGKAFGEAGGLEDHVVGLQQLAQKHPYMDLERVGIFGHSGGGFASTRAMLKFPDFFKVAVSSAGNHDQLGYLSRWGEFWIGFPDEENYTEQSNVALAENLKGKLLLVHGEMDDNVHPALTMQLVHALIEANKDFDMIMLPGRNHAMLDLTKQEPDPEMKGDAYFIRKRWDYFVENLLEKKPPTYELGKSTAQ